MPAAEATAPPALTWRRGLLYAAGDLGPSLTSLVLAFYWLFLLTTVAGLPLATAGLIHGSGFLFSSLATLAIGTWLDRRRLPPATRCAIIAGGGVLLGLCFAVLWLLPPPAWRIAWYLGWSWLFHLLFALVYLAYLSLTPLLGVTSRERVDLSAYRFGLTMLATIAALGGHALSEGRLEPADRFALLGCLIGGTAALGSLVCGLGLRRACAGFPPPATTGAPVAWRALLRDRTWWSAVGGNLAVWWMVQSALILTAFLCLAAGRSNAPVLLALEIALVAAVAGTAPAVRAWGAGRVLAAATAAWIAGAALWLGAAAPLAAAVLLGLGLGAGTVITWARIPDALDTVRRTTGAGEVDGRGYALLTFLRDQVSAVVPIVTGLALGCMAGSAAWLLLLSGLAAAVVLALLARRGAA